MRAIKAILTILGIILLCLVLLIAGVWIARSINTNRYAIPENPEGGDDRILSENGVEKINGDYMKGFHLSPLGDAHPGTVVVFGGSDGGANVEQAQLLRDNGYDVLGLYFFGQPGQKEFIDEVPLEFFDEVIAYANEKGNGVQPLTVIGTSKGAELTANLAARYPEISNIVLYAPGDHTYGNLNYQRDSGTRSSFTWKGEPVPFAAEQGPEFGKFAAEQGAEFGKLMTRLALGLPVSYRASYEAIAAAADPETVIDLSQFDGHGLLFAGTEDAMWQADVAAKALSEQNDDLEPHIYEGAGHLFHENIDELVGPSWETMMGGTVEANREAKLESDKILLERLEEWHES